MHQSVRASWAMAQNPCVCSIGIFRRCYRDRNIDQERYRGPSRQQSYDQQRPARDFDDADKRCQELGRRQSNLREAADAERRRKQKLLDSLRKKHRADEQSNQDHTSGTVTSMNQPHHSPLNAEMASQHPTVSNRTRSTALTRYDHVQRPAAIRKTLSGPALKKCETRPAVNARPNGIISNQAAR